MDTTLWLSLFSVCLLGAMSPGPSLAMVTKHTLSGGRSNGLITAWAHALGIGLYAMMVVLGLAVLLTLTPNFYYFIAVCGGGYLLYLGWGALFSQGGIANSLQSGEAMPLMRSAKEGFLVSILNPKIAIFFTALFSPFITKQHSIIESLILVLTPFLVDGLWYSLVTFVISIPLFMQTLKQHAKWVDRLSGVILLVLGGRVIISIFY